jgi:hypothetical protein
MIIVLANNISFASGTTNSTATPNIKVQDDDHSTDRHLKANHAKMTEQVSEGDVVTLKAAKSFEKDKNGKLTFVWEQLKPKKPKIQLDDADTPNLKFIAPNVDHSTIFTFTLLVTGSEYEYTDKVRVKVMNGVEKNKHENSDNNATKPEMNSQKDDENKLRDKTDHINNIKSSDNGGGIKETEQINNESKEPNSTSTHIQNGIDNKTEASHIVTLNCDPAKITVVTGMDSSLKCVVENKNQKIVEVALQCLGLEDTGIDCKINGENGNAGKLTLKAMSSETFSVVMGASTHKEPRGSFPFTISAELSS